MHLRNRIERLERLLHTNYASDDLRRQAAFAFPPGGKPPELPEDHFARPLVNLLIEMDRRTVPPLTAQGIIGQAQ
jgi:hypothetical protein